MLSYVSMSCCNVSPAITKYPSSTCKPATIKSFSYMAGNEAHQESDKREVCPLRYLIGVLKEEDLRIVSQGYSFGHRISGE